MNHGEETQSVRPHASDIGRAGVVRAAAAIAEHPREIGPYRILETLGEGGMGIVYLAEQTKPIHRRVALKIIKQGMDTRQVIARFETEREALALMNHANVAKVFDAGVSEQGRPYFVMEYVPGIPITEYCDKHRLNTEERLRLFMDVCNAIQHAHQKGIIHRDIKPSNVLVSVDQTAPPLEKGGLGGVAVKVIDFGVAKATQHRLTEQTLYTEQGQLIGTPGYMSPEQAEMTALDIDTRTDIYSLGVLLYELLVGAMPFDTKTLLKAGFAEIQRIIREVDPPKPSTRLSSLAAELRASARADIGQPDSARTEVRGSSIETIAHRRHTEPKTLIRQIRGELDWIVMRAMEKDRTRRYDTANGLAMEVQRYLNNEPVLAGPPSTIYRLKKFVRRNKAPVAVGTALVFLLTSFAVGMTVLYRRTAIAEQIATEERDDAEWARDAERKQRELAEKNLKRAEDAERRASTDAATSQRVSEFLIGLFRVTDPYHAPHEALAAGTSVSARELLDKGAANIRTKLSDEPAVKAPLLETMAQAYLGLGLGRTAISLQEEAIETNRRHFGRDNPKVAASLTRLARILSDTNAPNPDPAVIEALLGEALAIQRRGPTDDPELGVTLSRLAARITDTDTTELLLSEAIGMLRKHKHPELVSALQNAAAMSEQKGDLSAAESLYREACAVAHERLGDNHPDTWWCENTLGFFLLDRRGIVDEGESLIRKSIEEASRMLGPEHPDVISGAVNVGAIHWHRREWQEAEPYYRRNLEVSLRTKGSEDPLTLRTQAQLASVLVRQGRREEAERLYLDLLATLEKSPPKSKGPVAGGLLELAESLMDRGNAASAEPLVRRAFEIRQSYLNPGHERLVYTQYRLGWCLMSLGRYEDAEKVFVEALREVIRERSETDIQALDTLDRLVELSLILGKPDQLESYVATLLNARRKIAERAEATPRELNAYAWLLLSCEPRHLRNLTAALSLAEKAVKISEGKDLVIRDTLGVAHWSMGETAKAIEMFQQGMSRLQESDDFSRMTFTTRLAGLFNETGNHDAAEATLRQCEGVLNEKYGKEFAEVASSVLRLATELQYPRMWREHEALCDDLTRILAQGHLRAQPRIGEHAVASALVMIRRGDCAGAERILRECVELQMHALGGEEWRVFQTRSVLAEALACQRRFDEGQGLLLEAYEGFTKSSTAPPERLHDATERIVRLYQSWDAAEPGKGYAEKAVEWRAKLEETEATKPRSDEATQENTETPKSQNGKSPELQHDPG